MSGINKSRQALRH